MAEPLQIRSVLPRFSTEESILQQPISRYIAPTKRQARRHSGFHPYFTTRAFNVVQAYIQAATKPGEIVCDLFSGSGVTPVEALVLHRKAVAMDINPWALFITRMKAISPVDIGQLRASFAEVQSDVAERIRGVRNLSDQHLELELSKVWYPTDAIPKCVDQNTVGTVDQLFTPRQLLSLAWLLESIKRLNDQVCQDLLLLTFSATLIKVNRTYVSSDQRGLFRGQSRIFHHYKYAIAQDPTELNAWDAFEKRFHNVVKGKEETNRVIGNRYNEWNIKLYQESAGNATTVLGEESVDYVFTDPPYDTHIAYLDLSTLWCSWLGLDISQSNRYNEVITGGELSHTKDHYRSQLKSSLKTISAILKRDKWFSLVYVSDDPEIWGDIISTCESVGLKWVNAVPQPNTVLPSLTKIKNPMTTLSGELILNFQKKGKKIHQVTKVEEIPNLTKFFMAEASRVIVTNLGATTDEILFSVVSKLLATGILADSKILNETSEEVRRLVDLLPNKYESVQNYWHLQELQRPDGISGSSWIRYLVFRVLLSHTKAEYDSIVMMVSPFLVGDERIHIEDVLKQIAVREDDRWRIDPGLAIQLKLPLGQVPKEELPKQPKKQLMAEYFSDPVFKIKAVDLGGSSSEAVHEVYE